jgi:hypothetical protein
MTPDAVYTPALVLHGTRNATQHLQSVLVVMMDDSKSNIIVWLDDCLLHTKTEDELLATLNFFFKQCQKYGLKLHASKYVLYGSATENARGAERCRLYTLCRGSKLDAKRHTKLLEACGPSSISTGESVKGYKPHDEKSCSRSDAATPLGARGASGFQRFTRSYHGVNDVGILSLQTRGYVC